MVRFGGGKEETRRVEEVERKCLASEQPHSKKQIFVILEKKSSGNERLRNSEKER